MATRTEILLIDDIDGSSASETIPFALDGVTYEIDLSDQNASRLRADLSDWAKAARRIGVKAAKSAPRNENRSAYLKRLREWAKDNGHAVPERGRIPADVEKAYEAHLAR